MTTQCDPHNLTPETDWLALGKELLMVTPHTAPTVDATVEDHGSIVLLTPRTKECRKWLRDNVDEEAQWFGRSLVVEPRYLDTLITGMTFDGLIVK